MSASLPGLPDDGLLTPEVGGWGERKYKLVSIYAGRFATAMKHKWDKRVYIDLFAGAGRAKLKDSNRIVSGSPLLALGVKDCFDKYIFCEQDSGRLDALKRRVYGVAPGADVSFISGDVNRSVVDILRAMPRHGTDCKVLSFCFADPYRQGNLKFMTIRVLSKLYVDFMMLVPSFMDANRNEKPYLRSDNKIVDDYLGDNLEFRQNLW